MTRQTPSRSWRLHGRMNSPGSTATAGTAASASPRSAPPTTHRRTSASRFGEELRTHEDLPRLCPLAGADDPVLFHHVDEAGRLWVAQAHAALQERDRRLALADDEPHAVPVEVVAIGAAVAPGVGVALRRQVHFLVDRGALRAQELADALDLLVGQPRAVHAHLLVGARGDVDHVAASEELLGAVAVEHGARIDFRGHLKRNAR